MKPNDIKAELVRRNITAVRIAKDLGVYRPHVSLVISGTRTTKRIQEHIAGLIGRPCSEVFPVDREAA